MKSVPSRFALAVAAALLLVASFALPRPASAAPAKAPVFSLLTVDGRQLSSASLAGRPYIVNFFASWCPPCRAEIPDMVRVQKEWAPKGFTFVGIAVNERLPDVRAFMQRNGITYPVAMATPALVGSFSRHIEGGITGIPTTFVVDAGGNVVAVFVGPRSKEAFDQAIRSAFSPRLPK